MSWTRVPLRVLALGVDVEPGERVPGRIVAMEVYRREGRCDGIDVGAAVAEIDWGGLDEAIAWLDAQHRVLDRLARAEIDPVLAEIAAPFEGVDRLRSGPLAGGRPKK